MDGTVWKMGTWKRDEPESDGVPAAESLRGEIEHVRFWSEDTGYCVLHVRAKGMFGVMTVVGHLANPSIGAEVACEGAWKVDKKHGQQFKADRIEVVPPSSLFGIQKYLASGMIQGIGPGLAEKLVDRFGEDTLRIIEQEPDRLLEMRGIGKKRLESLKAAWAEQFAVRDVMIFLQTHGIAAGKATRIFRLYGQDSMRKIMENPYRLATEVSGIGFTTADRIAGKLGLPLDSPMRARAGMLHLLQEKATNGHCAMPRTKLIEDGCKLLEVPEHVVSEAITAEIDAATLVSEIVAGHEHVFLKRLYDAEVSVAKGLGRLLAGGKPPWGYIDLDWMIPWVEKTTGKNLSESQRAAVRLAVTNKVTVMTGGPGTGKTTIVNSILKILLDRKVTVALCAPTGRAAKRLFESTGHEAKTIHRTLEFDPPSGGFKRGPEFPINADFVIIDEASMADVDLMSKLIAAVSDRSALLIVGDVDQLPSVGPGAVLGDVIESGAVPTVCLTEVFRQAASSMIITNAHRINRGEMPIGAVKGDDSDFYLITPRDANEILPKLIETVTNRIPKAFGMDPMRDIQVLTPMHRGALGTQNLNLELQRALNADNMVTGLKTKRFGADMVFAVGDKVVQAENDYDKEVFNGDIGIVTAIDHEKRSLIVCFDGDHDVVYDSDELGTLLLAYAMSVHKSQGSEYPVVVLPLSMAHYTLLERNLLYTAVTRGKRLVVIIGEARAIERAVQNHGARHRVTGLMERMWTPVAPPDCFDGLTLE